MFLPHRLVATFLACLFALPLLVAPAGASEVRPRGYVERGHWQGKSFVPDAESNRDDGRYFRIGGMDDSVFYGLGLDPAIDWFFPSFSLNDQVFDTLNVAPQAIEPLQRYQEEQALPEGFARVGWLALVCSIGAAAGGLVYDVWPGNRYEMQKTYYWSCGGALAVGLLCYGYGEVAANRNFADLDAAIDAYNHDIAVQRRIQMRR